jgi:hypothetical protein
MHQLVNQFIPFVPDEKPAALIQAVAVNAFSSGRCLLFHVQSPSCFISQDVAEAMPEGIRQATA